MTDINSSETASVLLEKLIPSQREYKEPFPYVDIRWLRTRVAVPQEFNSDLDYYHSTIAGYVSWGPKILSWPTDKISRAKTLLASSFFAKHPQYSSFQNWITEAETPKLYGLLKLIEFQRITLLRLLELITTE